MLKNCITIENEMKHENRKKKKKKTSLKNGTHTDGKAKFKLTKGNRREFIIMDGLMDHVLDQCLFCSYTVFYMLTTVNSNCRCSSQRFLVVNFIGIRFHVTRFALKTVSGRARG